MFVCSMSFTEFVYELAIALIVCSMSLTESVSVFAIALIAIVFSTVSLGD